MKHFIVGFLFLLLPCSLMAQQSIGFSNPENIEPLLNYRLPDWGYSNLQTGLDFFSSGLKTKAFSNESLLYNLDFAVFPSYELYRESEERILVFSSGLRIGYDHGQYKQESSLNNAEFQRKQNQWMSNLFLNASLREYFTSNNFLYAEGTFSLGYRRGLTQQMENNQLTEKQVQYLRTVSFSPRVGYGFGRLRNVSPVIRALRLRERAQALNANLNFSNDDIQNAADQFTRYSGYLETYDRPQKYFWQDVDDAVAANLGALSAFEMLFLTDVLNEAIGTRLEGWEVIGGAVFNYRNNLNRTENRVSNFPVPVINPLRQENFTKELGFFASGRWYKNTSLKQQFGLFGDFTLTYPVGSQESPTFPDEEEQRNMGFLTGVNWLYNLTDRFLIESSLSNFYSRTKFEADGFVSEYSNWSNRIQLNMNFNMYIENDLMLNFSVRPALLYSGNTVNEGHEKLFTWQAGIGLTYGFFNSLY